MKFNETKRVGMDIFIINIILLLFIYSQEGLSIINLVLASFSSLIASSLNIYYLCTGSKTKINIIFLVINVVIAITINIFTIVKFI